MAPSPPPVLVPPPAGSVRMSRRGRRLTGARIGGVRLTRARIAAALIVLGLGALWAERVRIARHVVDDALAARGVPARYRVVRLGIGQQELRDVSIGDPARPDLTARRVVLTLGVGHGGPVVTGIAADGVRLRARLIDGAVRLGAIDRLLPASNGAPFALPELAVALSDARVRMATPAGEVALAVDGHGNLADGFAGRIVAGAGALHFGSCGIAAPRALLRVAITAHRPALVGPVRSAGLSCGGVAVAAPRAVLDARLAPAFDAWDGHARLAADGAARPGMRLRGLVGQLAFAGGAARTDGTLALVARDAMAGGTRAATLALDGRYVALPDLRAGRFAGTARATGVVPAPALLARVTGPLGGMAGTPLGPVGAALGRAISQAGRGIAARAEFAAQLRGGAGAVRVTRLTATSASGARLAATAAGGFELGWPRAALRIDGTATLAGGGLPALGLALRQPRAGAPFAGTLAMAPYAVPGARLALAPVRFEAVPGGTAFRTRATLDGPLGDGSVRALEVPLTGRIGAGGSFLLNAGCTPLAFGALAIAGLRVGPTRVPLCANGRALVWGGAGGKLAGGGSVAGPRLVGRLGAMPATIAAQRLGFTIGRPGFAADALAARLGADDAVSRLDIARLEGTVASGGVAGSYAGLGGQIARVPLVLSAGAGRWRLAGAVLDLTGRLRVADAAAAARFEPLASDDVQLRLAAGRIAARGWLAAPASGTRVAEVTIRHDLRTGTGDATLAVPGVAFTDKLQPEALTKLTLGIVANVRGTVAGAGKIAWGPQGVTSSGTFGTQATDLAAAFGPVKGIRTTIRFTDLLGLVSAPDQEATIAEVNPGIAVTGGVVRYRLLAGQQVAVASARWPFAGGTLLLEPTVLDFSESAQRRMTFRLQGMDAAQFVQQFELANIAVTGVFDGAVPMIFDATGGRIAGGRLAVREAGGMLAYVGEISNKDLGLFGSLAFDALKKMRYRGLAIELDGALDGEIVSRVLFDGTNETPPEAVRRHGLLSQFSNLPFRFRITIRAPFRGLLNSARSLNDPRGLIDQAQVRPPPAVGAPDPIQSR